MEVLLNINTWETFRHQPITFYNGYTLCKYEVLMSSRCLCIRVWVCVYQIPISCSLWVIVVGAKMSVLNTGVRLGEGWVGGSLLTLRCAEKLTHFYHGLKAPVCHTFDWSMFDYLHWNSDFEYWSVSIWKYFCFHPCTKHHTSDGCIGLNIRLNPNNFHWTHRTDFCLFDITGRNKVNHKLTCVKYFCQTGYHCLTPISTKSIYSWMFYTFLTHHKKVTFTCIRPYPLSFK